VSGAVAAPQLSAPSIVDIASEHRVRVNQPAASAPPLNGW
jgi:hypothetical protein